MARVFIDLKLMGTVDNAVAETLIGHAKTLRALCAEAGLELRGHGIEVVLDAVPHAVIDEIHEHESTELLDALLAANAPEPEAE